MKHTNKIILFLFAITSVFAACKKDKNAIVEDKLPPATQTGANTFGCLVNGKVYVPSGYSGGTKPNPHFVYDIGLNGLPTLNMSADKIENTNYKGSIFLSIGNLNHLGIYNYPVDMNFSVSWIDVIGTCGTIAFDTTIKKWGRGIVTKLDIPNRIISGTFNCKFKTLQCDTVFITDGRFDIKF